MPRPDMKTVYTIEAFSGDQEEHYEEVLAVAGTKEVAEILLKQFETGERKQDSGSGKRWWNDVDGLSIHAAQYFGTMEETKP